jgi:sugar (pentulose or hexulose) kinase
MINRGASLRAPKSRTRKDRLSLRTTALPGSDRLRPDTGRQSASCHALPYLSGERTPHNDPLARGGFMNLAHDTSPAMLGYSVLEGVGFALRDAMNSVESIGATVARCSLGPLSAFD